MGMPVDPHRLRLLRAMGVLPMRLRAQAGMPPENPHAERSAVATTVVAAPVTEPSDGGAAPACVLVMPASRAGREDRFIELAVRGLGPAFAPAVRALVNAGGELPEVPTAGLYLAFGEAQARALGRALSGPAIEAAEVLLLDRPEDMFRPEAKRRLWQSARRWHREQAHGPAGGG